MKGRNKEKSPMQRWGEKINWERRVKAVCKPCWEIKYCPYGPLVEAFPLAENRHDKSCRIFGHDCPVFYVAEPLTETKELRNISRSIPRIVQFRVLKRENQICSECGNSVKDEDVEFDHIIPWSKGGCSDEHNIRLLCYKCNRKKGSRFEERHLVESVSDHVREKFPYKFIEVFIQIIEFVLEFKRGNHTVPTAQQFCKLMGRRKVTPEDQMSVELLNDIESFFSSPRPRELRLKEFNALKFRWGAIDIEFHTLKESASKFGIDINTLLEIEHNFIDRLGFYVRITESDKKKWLKK